MTTPREHILNLSPDELTERLKAMDMPAYRAKQVLEWIFAKRAATFAEMTNLSLLDRQRLDERFVIFSSHLVRQQRATDGTEKVLLAWPGANDKGKKHLNPATPTESLPIVTDTPDYSGGLTEGVMIPCDDDQCDEYGNTTVAHRRTACLSTQVGCPVQCKFCASGIEGLQRNLTLGQVVEEALRLQQTMPIERRLTNIVFMGMGEPLANFDVTVAALRVLTAPWAFHISARKITVSTVGLPPQMKRLADVGLPVTLAISLHAPNDALRSQIIPWAQKISIAQIVQAGQEYFTKTGREVTLEYIMLDGINTLPQHARELAAIAKQLRANINLIYYNEVPELEFKRPSGNVVHSFQNALRAAGVNAHIRKSRGREIAAACGQLARQEKTAQSATLAQK